MCAFHMLTNNCVCRFCIYFWNIPVTSQNLYLLFTPFHQTFIDSLSGLFFYIPHVQTLPFYWTGSCLGTCPRFKADIIWYLCWIVEFCLLSSHWSDGENAWSRSRHKDHSWTGTQPWVPPTVCRPVWWANCRTVRSVIWREGAWRAALETYDYIYYLWW